jgi:hypothetical protein
VAELSLGTIPPSLRTGLLQARDLLLFLQPGRFNMSKKTAVEMISRRRMLGILGAGVAFGMGAPAAVLTATEAGAQTPSPPTPGSQTPGSQPPGANQRPDRRDESTRQDRRADRTEGRQDRRTSRTNRRIARRRARRERAMARQEARRQRRTARPTGTRTSPGTGTTGTGTTGQAPARQ